MSLIQFYSYFISYSTGIPDFANRLRANLQANGVRCSFGRKDPRIGSKIRDRITEVIRIHDNLILVLTEQSIARWRARSGASWTRHDLIRIGGRVARFVRHTDAPFEVATGFTSAGSASNLP
jgi:hypothetical protein